MKSFLQYIKLSKKANFISAKNHDSLIVVSIKFKAQQSVP